MESGIHCVDSRVHNFRWNPRSISADLMESVSLESGILNSRAGIWNPWASWIPLHTAIGMPTINVTKCRPNAVPLVRTNFNIYPLPLTYCQKIGRKCLDLKGTLPVAGEDPEFFLGGGGRGGCTTKEWRS